MVPFLYFAGIGSRNAPREILDLMSEIGTYLSSLGYVLRSGKAIGSDTAFEKSFTETESRADIWLPWPGYNKHQGVGYYPNEQHFEIAKTLHPIWDKLPRYVKFLHARNVGQILGSDCNSPVRFVVCWTPDGCESDKTRTSKTGGTGTAISLASRNNIPIFNLFNTDAVDRLFGYLRRNVHYPNCFNSFYDDEIWPSIPEEMVLVYGSNLAGRHGYGAALQAYKHFGARYGQGIGLSGRSYGIPTKDKDLTVLELRDIIPFIQEFVEFTHRGDRTFLVTAVGTGLAGYQSKDIAPFFKGSKYCQFPKSWLPYLL